MTTQIKSSAQDLIFDKHGGLLQDLSVKWVWDAYTPVNKQEIVKKVRNNYEQWVMLTKTIIGI